jgi:hypothetical protein
MNLFDSPWKLESSLGEVRPKTILKEEKTIN